MKVLDIARKNRSEGPPVTATFARINTLLAMAGDRREEVKLLIMPPVLFADMVGDSITNYHADCFPFGDIYFDVVQAFGRIVLIPPGPSVPVYSVENEGDYAVCEVVAIGGPDVLVGRFNNTAQDGRE